MQHYPLQSSILITTKTIARSNNRPTSNNRTTQKQCITQGKAENSLSQRVVVSMPKVKGNGLSEVHSLEQKLSLTMNRSLSKKLTTHRTTLCIHAKVCVHSYAVVCGSLQSD